MIHVDSSLRTAVFQKYTILQMWLLRRVLWYAGLFYLVTLVFFALLRLFTGVSIKRIGYFSLRHISFSPTQGLEVRIGKLGLTPHRPTIARPGYLSFVLSNLEVVADLEVINQHKDKPSSAKAPESNIWDRGLTDLNLLEGLPIISKRYPRTAKITRWFLPRVGAFNLLFNSASLVTVGVNTTACTSANLHVDLRATRNLKLSNFVGTLDNHRLAEGDLPINVKLMLQDIYVADSLEDETPWQLFDDLRFDLIAFLNLHEMKVKNISTQIHTNRLQIDVGQFIEIFAKANKLQNKGASGRKEESSTPDSATDKHKLIKGSKILLHLLNRVQLTAGTVEVQRVPLSKYSGSEMLFASSMKDLNIDLTRMNPTNSGFRLLYDSRDAAHQMLFTVASFTLAIDSNGAQEEVLYVPLITSLSRGNIFSQTLSFVQETTDINQATFRSRWAVHAPNISLEHHQLPEIVKSFLKASGNSNEVSTESFDTETNIGEYQSYLPKLDLEVIFSDPAIKAICDGTDEYYTGGGMFVAEANSLRLSMKASHNEHSYEANGSTSLRNSKLYYVSPTIPKVIISTCAETRTQIYASTMPTLHVDLTGKNTDFVFKAMHYEVFRACGLLASAVKLPYLCHNKHRRTSVDENMNLVTERISDNGKETEGKPCLMRRIPKWLHKFSFECERVLFLVASDKFRSHSNDLLGLQISSEHLQLVYYNTPIADYSTDGRLLTITGSSLSIMKADKRLLIDNYSERSHRIADIPKLSLSVNTHSINYTETSISIEPRLRVDLNINLILAFSVVREILDFALARHIKTSDAEVEEMAIERKHSVSKHQKHSQSELESEKPKYNYISTTEVARALIRIDLPSDDQVMFELINADVHAKNKHVFWKSNATRMYSEHPFQRGSWCILASLVGLSSTIELNKLRKLDEDSIKLDLEQFRINVPYQFKLYRVIDNGITLAKAIKTLLLQTKKRDNKLVLDPKIISSVPLIPQVHINAKQLLLSLEDDYFEADMQLCTNTRVENVAKYDRKVSAFASKIKQLLQKGRDLASMRERNISPRQSDSENSFVHAMHKTSTVFGEHIGVSASHPRTGAMTLNSLDRAILRATLYAVNQYGNSSVIDELICTPLELGTPDLDNPKTAKGHVWLEFWSLPAFKPFRELQMILADGEKSKLNIAEARVALVEDLDRAWIDTIKYSRMQQHLGAKLTAQEFCTDELDPGTCSEENIVDYSQKPLLFSVSFRDMDLVLSPTELSTPDKLHDFLYKIGKGLPRDSEFSILLPVNINLQAKGGLCVNLRDYPLPILHFPQLAGVQKGTGATALQIKGKVVITEQMSFTEQSIRKLYVPLKPGAHRKSDILEIRRTLTPVKTFTDLNFRSESTLPSRICYCKSYGPAFNAVGQAFSSFSKPPLDPSPALGFWDKIRLILHARFKFELPNSPLLLMLKGGKSPYTLLNNDSGFVFSWKNNVNVLVNEDDDPRRLIFVDSDFFELFVPDFAISETEYLNCSPADRAFPRPPPSALSTKPAKVVFSFPKKTTWKLGMAFEKPGEDGTRNSDFKPHYKVRLSMPEFVKDMESYDAYEGFRSEFIHMSISVVSNQTNEINDKRCATHITHGVLKHFKAWKSQFTSEYWPPIRTGSLFPDPVRVRPSKKTFGAALSTAEYQIALAPVDLSFFHYLRHHKVAKKYERCTGLKAKMDEFVFDWHTRREPPRDENGLPNHCDTRRRWKMKSYCAEIDLKKVNVKVVDAKIKSKYSNNTVKKMMNTKTEPENAHLLNNEDMEEESMDEYDDSDQESTTTGKTEPSTQPGSRQFGPRYMDNDVWADLDDYTEIGRISETQGKPSVNAFGLLYSPRICYIRKTDYSQEKFYVSPDDPNSRFQKFVDSGVHDCLMSHTYAEETQCSVIEYRMNQLSQQLSELRDSLESLQNDSDKSKLKELEEMVKIGQRSMEVLQNELDAKHEALENRKASERIVQKARDDCKIDPTRADQVDMLHPCDSRQTSTSFHTLSSASQCVNGSEIDKQPNDIKMFVNNYSIHAVHLKWNNTIRNLIFRLQVSLDEERELYYVRCRRSVQYLEELVKKATEQIPHNSGANAKRSNPNNKDIKLGDITDFFSEMHSAGEGRDITYSHNVQFLSPRVQLIAEENPDKCLQLVARDIELQVVDIYCHYRPADADSGQIEKRMGFVLRNSAFYTISEEDAESTGVEALCLEKYSGEGNENSSWPPWLALETCYQVDILQKFMIVRDISFGVRYDQPNDLHVAETSEAKKPQSSSSNSDQDSMDYSSDENSTADESLTTVLLVNAPQLLVTMDSEQFATVYMIGMDLLTYRDPLIIQREEAINRMFLSTDFSGDYTATLRNIESIQADINTLVDLREKIYLLSLKEGLQTDKDVELYLIKLSRQFTRLKTKLTVLIRAFKTSIRRRMKTGDEKNSKWVLNADSIVLQILENTESPVMESIVKHVRYSRTTDGDNGATHKVTLGGLYGRNQMANAFYPQMAATMNPEDHCAFKAHWTMLNRVGGIPVLEDAEVRVEPIHIQLEQAITDKLLDFVFPIKNHNEPDNSSNDDGSTNAYEEELELDSDDSSNDAGNTSMDSTTKRRRILRFRKQPKQEPKAGSIRSFDSGNSDIKPSKSLLSRVVPHKANAADVEIMLKRASNYQAIRRLHIHPMELMVSYRGNSSYSILNIHNLKIPMCDILIENKTWTRLDLIMRIKRQVVKALVSQSGSILSNKFKKPKEIEDTHTVYKLAEELDKIEPLLDQSKGLLPVHRIAAKAEKKLDNRK